MKHIFDIDMVRPDMKLAETIKDDRTGAILIAAGTKLTEKHIDTLKRRNIDELAVSLTEKEKEIYQYDNNIIPTVNRSVIKSAVKAIKSIDGIKPLDEKAIQTTIENARRIVDSILMDANFTYKLTDYKMNTEPSEHSVRTATYAVALANAYNQRIYKKYTTLTESEKRKKEINLENIAIASLLHDIGKLCADEKVRTGIKRYSFLGDICPGLTEEKYYDLQKNYDEEFVSYYGYNIINDTNILPSEVKAMVLFSSEDEALTGPLKAQKGIISSTASHIMASKMINICSRFDEYMMENIKDKVTLENAHYKFFDLFIRQNLFDKDLLVDFVNTIPLYPVGTKVLLQGSISGYAIVTENFADARNYSKPKLLTIPDGLEVDLRTITDTTIRQVIGDEVQMYKLFISDNEEVEEESYGKAM